MVAKGPQIDRIYKELIRRAQTTGEVLGDFTDTGGRGSDGLLRLDNGNVLIAYNVDRNIREYQQDGTFVRIFANRFDGIGNVNGFLVIPEPAAVWLVLLGVSVCVHFRRRLS